MKIYKIREIHGRADAREIVSGWRLRVGRYQFTAARQVYPERIRKPKSEPVMAPEQSQEPTA